MPPEGYLIPPLLAALLVAAFLWGYNLGRKGRWQ